ncbi:MAG: zinc ribbon domain-containing protein [Anaerolineales bacterium]|nr:zinc ribbon domain-containing protein [Anaerolineales bacterium]
MSAPILCPHCGHSNQPQSAFCSRCGASLRSESAPPPRPSPAPPPESSGQPLPGEEEMDFESSFEPEDEELEDEEQTLDAGISAANEVVSAPGRLVSGVQGLLEPIRVATAPGEGDQEQSPPPPTTGYDPDQLRRVRTLLAEEPLIAGATRSPSHQQTSLWMPWVFLLIGVAVAVPILFQWARPLGQARQWPGVAEAFSAINRLQNGDTVQVLWAYDPATAGELDLLAAPLVQHMLDKGARLEIISLLPNGPATARRLVSGVRRIRSQEPGITLDQSPIDARFVPGGAMVLPAFGATPAALAVVFGAQAEDVQAWLELVAPRNRTPVVAVTAAGADPVLRPYLDSGQLKGLVSGFDGAASYSRLLYATTGQPPNQLQLAQQLVGQNFALIAFLALIVTGNLVAALTTGRRHE